MNMCAGVIACTPPCTRTAEAQIVQPDAVIGTDNGVE